MEILQLLREGVALQNQGLLEEAKLRYEKVISIAPRHADAHFMLASVYQRLGNMNAAVANCNLAINVQPKAGYLNLLGACYLFKHEDVAAELCFRQAITLQADFADPYNNLGLLLLNQRRIEEAREVLEKAAKLAPHDINTQCNLARVFREQDRFQDAVPLYERALLLEPGNSNAIMGMAICCQMLGYHEKSLEMLEQISADDKVNGIEALGIKGSVLNILGRLDEACVVMDRALSLAPHLYGLANARAQMRKVTKGEPFFVLLQTLEQKLDTAPSVEKTPLFFALGKAYHDVGDIEKAANFYRMGGSNLLQMEGYDEQKDLLLLKAISKEVTAPVVKKYSDQAHESRCPIFILGMERSGTTLTEQIIGSHPMVFPGGELKSLSAVLSGFELAGKLRFNDNAQELFAQNASLRDRANAYLQKLTALPDYAGQPYVTDKMPENFRNLGFIRMLFPNARIIHCRRDPIDTCISSYTTSFSHGIRWSFDQGMLGRRFRAYWEMMEHWRREFPGEFLEIRYEETIADIEAAARKLLAWCDLPWDDQVLRFYESERPVLTASVTQVRKPIYTSSVGRWKKWEPYIQPLLDEIGDLEIKYWEEVGVQSPLAAGRSQP